MESSEDCANARTLSLMSFSEQLARNIENSPMMVPLMNVFLFIMVTYLFCYIFLLPTAYKKDVESCIHHYEALDCPNHVISKTHVVKIYSSPEGGNIYH